MNLLLNKVEFYLSFKMCVRECECLSMMMAFVHFCCTLMAHTNLHRSFIVISIVRILLAKDVTKIAMAKFNICSSSKYVGGEKRSTNLSLMPKCHDYELMRTTFFAK